MLGVNIDSSDPLELDHQVATRIRRAIADDEARPGERLPLAKGPATVLGVNKNTVLRALHLLRDEGPLEFRRGRGITGPGHRSEARSSPRPGAWSSSPAGPATAVKNSSR